MTADTLPPVTDNPFTDAGVCVKRPYCQLPAGHSGLCRKHPPGSSASKRTASVNGRRRGRPRKGVAARKAPAGSTGAAPAAPTRRPGRSSSEGMRPLLAFLWGGMGQLIEAYAPEPSGPPVGRVIQFQAPYAANRLHPQLRKLPAYRALDESVGGVLDDLGPILLAPLIAGVMAQNDKAATALWPLLAMQIEAFAGDAAAEMERARKAMRTIDADQGEARELTDLMLSGLFKPRDPRMGPAEPDAAAWEVPLPYPDDSAAPAGAPAAH